MTATITNAVIPKARGMYARKPDRAEYEELMRRRTVPEVAAVLRRHPYFQDHLASLSPTDPHRGQLEELLDMDLFLKYESLARYDPGRGGFSGYYMASVETRQILTALQFLSIGAKGMYLGQIPPYLVGKTRLDLYALAGATSFEAALAALAHTPYYRPLAARCKMDPNLQDFPATEHALLRFYYEGVFGRIEACFSGVEKQSVRGLFLQEVEVYNLELMFRVKAFYSKVYDNSGLATLLLPWHYRVNPAGLEAMVQAQSPEALLALYRGAGVIAQSDALDMDSLVAAGGRNMCAYARHLLRLTASPAAALAAFLVLAGFERDNVVNVIEGVRYALPPEKIRSMLRF